MKQKTLVQGTPDWLAFRLNGVGGSEAAAIAEIPGAFQKRAEILQEKATGAKRELSSFEKNLFQAGHQWEDLTRNAMNAGGTYNFVPMVVVRDENERLFASLDGIDLERETILEIKSVMNLQRFEQYIAETPAHYEAQVQWQMFVTGYDQAIIAFVHEGEVISKWVAPNIDLQHRLHAKALEFLQELDAIKAGSKPAPVQTLSTHEMSRLAYLKRVQADMKIQLDMMDEEIKAISEKIITEMNANRVESDEVTIQVVERRGSIDYTRIPEVKNLGESYLNSFRGKGSKSIQVKLKGTNA